MKIPTLYKFLAALGLSVTPATAQLMVDFNSNQSGGGVPTAGDPGDPTNAAHQEDGWQCYHAQHETIADFVTAAYDTNFTSGAATVEVTPSWPNTTDRLVQQSIGRSQGQADTWTGNNVNMLRDWIGADARPANGGNNSWDRIGGTATQFDLTFGDLPAATYALTTFHHDVENMCSEFQIEVSVDGGTTFSAPVDGRMTNSLSGGNPAENEVFAGTDPNNPGGDPADLSSTQVTEFTATGADVVVRFSPFQPAGRTNVHVMFIGVNGFILDQTFSLDDEDGDDLPDAWEDQYFGDNDGEATPAELALQDGGGDPDMDNLDNETELSEGTNPTLDDTDMDDLRDDLELDENTNPNDPDSDDDGLTDGDEVNVLGTDPLDPDSDGDMMPDGYEAGLAFLDPTDMNDGALDEDSDGLDNTGEFLAGTDPENTDSDGDGLKDGDEVNVFGTDPLSTDSDGDTLDDGDEVNTFGTDPASPDTDGDGSLDGVDPDALDPTKPSAGETLCAYWPLDSTDGTTTPDLGPGGYDMMLTNMSAANFVVDEGRNVASFDNATNTLLSYTAQPGDDIPINLHPAFTVTMWVKIAGTGQNDLRMFSESSTASGTPLFNMGTRNNGSDDSFDLYVRPTGGPVHEFSNGFPLDGTWRHLAITGNDALGQYLFYVDGVLDRDDFTYRDMSGVGLDITTIGGILRADASHWVTGLMDDVALFKKVLAPDTIADLASGTPPDSLGGPGFAITSVSRAANGDVTLVWNAKPGRQYVVRFADNLDTDPLTWPDLADDVEAEPGESTATFTDAGTPLGERFYVVEEL